MCRKGQARVYIGGTAAPRARMEIARPFWPRLEHPRPMPEKLQSPQQVPAKYLVLPMRPFIVLRQRRKNSDFFLFALSKRKEHSINMDPRTALADGPL